LAAPKTFRRSLVVGAFALAALLAAGLARADQALVDNDLALPGNQNVVSLTAQPGDTVETSGQVVVRWSGNRHLAPGDTLTFTADPAATTLPAGYVVAPVTLTVPAAWGPGSSVSGLSAISFSAPAAGQYQYTVKWRPQAAASTCAGPPCLTGGSGLVINLTVNKVDLESLTVAGAQRLMNVGALTSVELTQLYLDRIAALNSHGPGLNAVRILNPNALAEAAAADEQRAQGHDLGPLMGIPVLVKDNLDAAGLPTTAGAIALEQSFPPEDSTVVAKLRAGGAVLLGKTNLSEFANFITNSNPSGYSGLGGQVLAAPDADLNPSGSSSGSATAAAAALATVTIGTETSGSIVSPSAQQGVVGLRPTAGLVSRYGIVPIAASQDTAGPIVRTVADAAAELQVIAGPDPKDHSPTLWGPGVDDAAIIPPQPSPVPDYLAALDPNALNGKRIGVITNSEVNYQAAIATIQALGATAVLIPTPTATPTAQILFYEFKRDLNNYLAHLGPGAPMDSLADVIAFNEAHTQEAIKFGHTILAQSQALDVDDPSSADSVTYRTDLVNGKDRNRAAIDNALTTNALDAIMTPSGTLTGIGARAGYPQIVVPAGYAATTRRPVNIAFSGTKYTEASLIGFAYAFEQATHARRPVSVIDPSLYRCAKTDPPSPFASRGGCAPGSELLDAIGAPPNLGFSLETATASELESRLEAGTLTSVALTKAYLARIAKTNVDGPSINAVRSVNPHALDDAAASDARRAAGQARGPLEGLPVLLNDDIDAHGLPTTLGSVALQDSVPAGNSTLAARLEAAGAIVLGKTNPTELSGWTSTSMPSGYSSLGGQVLNPSDADLNPSGSSSGAAAATAAGLAALTFGTGGSSVAGSLLSIVGPSQANGVVGLKPTVGLVSRAGILTITQTQETAGPIGRTVRDVAGGLQAVAGADPADPATLGQPPLPDYLAGLSTTALAGKRIAVVSSVDPNLNAAVAAVQAAGGTTVIKTIPAPSPNPPDIVGRELKRDANAYLGALPAGAPVHSLQQIVDYNLAHPDEALKYGQGMLTAANAVDLSEPATNAAYVSDRDTGRASNRAVIDTMLNNGTPGETSDDFDAILVAANTLQSGNTLTGIADRAGYPQLTVPAGYDLDATKTFNPVNVSFVGTAYSEATLLADAYAYEQATNLRLAPSFTNPSLWRCVPGSAFAPHSCPP
jgi:amidase